MKYTRHMRSRMSQRAINKRLVELAMEFGESDGDKTVLDRDDSIALAAALDEWKRTAVKAADKGGLVVVQSDDGTLITTYGLHGHRRRAHGIHSNRRRVG